jgi:L-aspartate semialdehyde sulfurtransferase ferredoxin
MQTVDLTVIAGGQQVSEPWIWRLSREFSIEVNIQKASIDEDYGWVRLQLKGPIEEIQRATAWLMTTGMHIEADQRAVGAA